MSSKHIQYDDSSSEDSKSYNNDDLSDDSDLESDGNSSDTNCETKVSQRKKKIREVFVKIRFKVTGFDHSGYCSGAEASSGDEISDTTTKIIKIEKRALRKDDILKKLSFVRHGCTSIRGSGYCSGYHQIFKARSFRTVEGADNKCETEIRVLYRDNGSMELEPTQMLGIRKPLRPF